MAEDLRISTANIALAQSIALTIVNALTMENTGAQATETIDVEETGGARPTVKV
ncbi:hypothetical protein BKD09_15375 [Bradyrhizobium japonicum]|uniref:Uncharacterized protein n=1 Tax=Bradyrhizobium japonicum TaxID=375 RepID=A0A1L3F8U9_BRAJP|nr:hypothetical protein BKD09_15375 [Bradyrhizobium japonicum]